MSSLLYMYVAVATSCCHLPAATADVFVRAAQGSYETMDCIHTTASDSTRVCVVVISTGLVPPRLVVRPVPLFVRLSRHPSRLSHLPPKYPWSLPLSRNFFRTDPTQQFKEQKK